MSPGGRRSDPDPPARVANSSVIQEDVVAPKKFTVVPTNVLFEPQSQGLSTIDALEAADQPRFDLSTNRRSIEYPIKDQFLGALVDHGRGIKGIEGRGKLIFVVGDGWLGDCSKG